MIRDMGNRRVDANDQRVIARFRARLFQGRTAPRKHTASVWPRLAPYSCRSCRREHLGDPRRDGIGPTHWPTLCAERLARYGV